MKCRVCGYEGPSLQDLLRPGVKITTKFAGVEFIACPECGVVQVANLDECQREIRKRRVEAYQKERDELLRPAGETPRL